MPNACLEMLTTFPVVRCCAHFFLHVGWHVFALTRTNACTDFVGLFPSLSNGCIVTVHIRRALHWLHCFPALFVAYNFLSVVQANFPAFCTLCTECILHCTSLLSLSWSRPNSLSHRKSEFVKENEKWRGTYWRLFKITPQQHDADDKNQQSFNWTQTFLIAEKWLTLQEFSLSASLNYLIPEIPKMFVVSDLFQQNIAVQVLFDSFVFPGTIWTPIRCESPL